MGMIVKPRRAILITGRMSSNETDPESAPMSHLPPKTRGYRLSYDAAPRTLKTTCGPVTYLRAYLVPRRGGGPGVHPLDVELGLTRDSFSPLLIGWFCRLATRVSFRLSTSLGEMFLGDAPPVSTIEEWVLGLARPAYVYLSTGPLPEHEAEALVIQCH